MSRARARLMSEWDRFAPLLTLVHNNGVADAKDATHVWEWHPLRAEADYDQADETEPMQTPADKARIFDDYFGFPKPE